MLLINGIKRNRYRSPSAGNSFPKDSGAAA